VEKILPESEVENEETNTTLLLERVGFPRKEKKENVTKREKANAVSKDLLLAG